MKKLLLVGLMLLIWGISGGTFAQKTNPPPAEKLDNEARVELQEEEKVDHLINFLRHLEGATFIRNGKDFTPAEAADHLNSKWEKHKERVKTARGFVEKLASFSKTKEPYQIRYADGRTIKCGDLLSEELHRIEK